MFKVFQSVTTSYLFIEKVLLVLSLLKWTYGIFKCSLKSIYDVS